MLLYLLGDDMSEVIEKTYKLLDTLDNSSLIKNLTKYKNKLLKDKMILLKIEEIRKETDAQKLILLRKELYENKDYRMYMKYYQELSLIVLKINKKYAEYTSTREHGCHG